jgi:hypothetical protein
LHTEQSQQQNERCSLKDVTQTTAAGSAAIDAHEAEAALALSAAAAAASAFENQPADPVLRRLNARLHWPAFFLNSNFKYLESSPGIFHAAASVVSRHSFPVFSDNTKHVEVSDGRFQHGCPFLETPRSFRRKIPARLPVSGNSTKFPTEDSSTAARFWKLEQDFS